MDMLFLGLIAMLLWLAASLVNGCEHLRVRRKKPGSGGSLDAR
jgi:hypothetical protein